MIRGLYASALGMSVQMTRQDVVAQNLANVSTHGYRRLTMGVVSFPAVLASTQAAPAGTPIVNPPTLLASTVATDVSTGVMRPTGNPTDLALSGDAYFAIDASTDSTLAAYGPEVYTRNGAFTLDMASRLVTADGRPVLGQSGPITITGAHWEVGRDGTVTVDGRQADQLKIMAPLGRAGQADPGLAEATRLPDGLLAFAGATPATGFSVAQGYVEGSNVSSVTEMVSMITATRMFEANQKALQAQDATLDRAVNDIARV